MWTHTSLTNHGNHFSEILCEYPNKYIHSGSVRNDWRPSSNIHKWTEHNIWRYPSTRNTPQTHSRNQLNMLNLSAHYSCFQSSTCILDTKFTDWLFLQVASPHPSPIHINVYCNLGVGANHHEFNDSTQQNNHAAVVMRYWWKPLNMSMPAITVLYIHTRDGGRIFFSTLNFVYWLLFGVCSTLCYCSGMLQWHVKDPGHSAKSAGGRLQLNTHAPSTQLEQADYAVHAQCGNLSGNVLKQRVMEHLATDISAHWVTVNWSWHKRAELVCAS